MVYPIPIKGHPFGGSHSCVTVNGKIKLGPAMIPCLKYENYETPVNVEEIEKKYSEIFKANPEFHKALIEIEIPLLEV
jgi:L-2-hydroxyglutarate oxidase LhgO